MTILLTGATGFIGSHIAKSLIKEGHTVYATCRNNSNYNKCNDLINKIQWLNQDKKDWEKELYNVQLDILIHAAWTGITSSERNDWFLQLSNFEYSKFVIDLSIRLGVKKIICLGSQAEYGLYDYKVTEEHTPMPTDSYGAIKLLTLYYLQNTASKYFIH
jgi:nucleoside-diphosphate-sugar epimerase